AASDLLLKSNENSDIHYGDSLINDQYYSERFDYFLANPPFGVDWKMRLILIVTFINTLLREM
ncbi:MAG: N-6 DNA methylase, partial [Nostoc sp.]